MYSEVDSQAPAVSSTCRIVNYGKADLGIIIQELSRDGRGKHNPHPRDTPSVIRRSKNREAMLNSVMVLG
jgi:hypothetical protein